MMLSVWEDEIVVVNPDNNWRVAVDLGMFDAKVSSTSISMLLMSIGEVLYIFKLKGESFGVWVMWLKVPCCIPSKSSVPLFILPKNKDWVLLVKSLLLFIMNGDEWGEFKFLFWKAPSIVVRYSSGWLFGFLKLNPIR